MHWYAGALQNGCCLPVTQGGVWLVVIIGKNRFDSIFSGDLSECFGRGGVINPEGGSGSNKLPVQLFQGCLDECHSPVCSLLKPAKNLSVEDKHRKHGIA